MGTLAAKDTWFSLRNTSGIEKSSIASITIFPSYSTTLDSYTYNWDASDVGDNSVKCYSDGTNLAIVDMTGAGIYLNADSYNAFDHFTNATSIANLTYLNASNVTNMSYMFKHCEKVTSLDLSNWDVSKVTNMYQTFYYLPAVTSINTSGWNTQNVKSMGYMFGSCWKLNPINLSHFNTSSVTSLAGMFSGCYNVVSINLANWNTSNVTDMSYMFGNCYKLSSLDISHFNTSKVTDMSKMFSACDLTSLDLSNWDTSNVTNMSDMLRSLNSLTSLNISNWDTSKVTDMSGMFEGYPLASLDLSGWDTSSLTNISQMFASCESLVSLNLSNWDTSKVTDMSSLFQGAFSSCPLLTDLNITGWDTSSVTNMQSAFMGLTSLTSLNLSSWDVSKVTDMNQMFAECSALTSIGDVSNWDTARVANMEYMFLHCTSLVSLDLSSWDVSNVTNMHGMFTQNNYGSEPTAMTTLNVSGWDTSKVTDMSFMFYGLSKVNSLDVSAWKVSKCANFDHMFSFCRRATIDVSKWKTSAATNMYAMFHSTANTEYDVSNFDTSNVTVFGQMFEGCGALTKIIGLDKFDTSKGIDFTEMFQHCYCLTSLNLSSFDTTKANQGVTVSTNGGTSQCTQNIFNDCTRLKRITLGENFTFKGDGTASSSWYGTLPTPTANYIEHADGNWYTANGGVYAPSDIPDKTAATYYASVNLLYEGGLIVSYDAMLNIANAIREAGNIEGKMTVADMPTLINDALEVAKTSGETIMEGYPLTINKSDDGMELFDYSITGAGAGDIEDDGKYHFSIVNSPLNLFNAQTDRTEREPGNYSSSDSQRPNLNGKGIYKGFACTGGYYAGNAEYIIHDDNSMDLTYIGNDPYGVGFDFHLKPDTYYVCNCAENRQYISAVYYKQDGTYIGWEYISNNKKWMIPDECYWTLIVLAGMTTDTVPLSFTDIGLYAAETLQPFEPYRGLPTIVAEVSLDEPLGSKTQSEKNLFNALTDRTIKERVGSYEPAGVRSNMDGTVIHIGIGYSNYYIPSMVTAYEIISDNSLSVSSSDDYGVGFEFILEPSANYTLSFERTEGDCAVWALFFDENGTYLNNHCIISGSAFTVPANAYFTVINFLHYRTQTNGVPATSTITNIQLEKGTVATEFEPYYIINEETVTCKNGILPEITVSEGTNIITVEATNEPTSMKLLFVKTLDAR